MNTARFSRVACWPTKSSSDCGRRLASAASCSLRTGEIVRLFSSRAGSGVAGLALAPVRYGCDRSSGRPLRQFLQAVAQHGIQRCGIASPVDNVAYDGLHFLPAITEVEQG